MTKDVARAHAALAAALSLSLAACGTGITKSASPTPTASESRYVLEAPWPGGPSEQPKRPATTVVPMLQANTNPDESAQIAASVAEIPGVAAVARLGIGNLPTESDSGSADVSVVWADPVEFRPFAPNVTARADFVWRGLARGEVFLAHEESRILGAPSGSRLFVTAPAGLRALRVGGVASNGIPNFAGALISRAQGASLGLPQPNLILVGKDSKTTLTTLQKELKKRLPDTRFEVTAAGAGHTFLGGGDSARLFGTFTFTRNPDGSIVPDEAWVSKNIVSKSVPILGTVRCHRLLFPQLIAALMQVQGQGASNAIDVAEFHRVGGCYVPRLVRGENPNRPVSMHAWGLALDMNVGRNPSGAPPNQDPRLVAAFERWGFRWGGRWSPPDAHHFELASLIKK